MATIGVLKNAGQTFLRPVLEMYYFDDSILRPRAGYRPGDPFLTVEALRGHKNTAIQHIQKALADNCHP